MAGMLGPQPVSSILGKGPPNWPVLPPEPNRQSLPLGFQLLMDPRATLQEQAKPFPDITKAYTAQGPVGQVDTSMALDFMGPVGSIISKSAKGWSKPAEEFAEKLYQRGYSDDEIWRRTGELFASQNLPYSGLYKAGDGNWYTEITDIGSDLKRLTKQDQSLSQALDHPELFEEYPALKAILIKEQNMPKNLMGTHWKGREPTKGRPGRVPEIRIASKADDKNSVLHHELTHSIQNMTPGAARGGTSRGVSEEDYNRLAGEEQARAVQKRMMYTLEDLRKRGFWKDFDTPMINQLGEL